METVIIKIKKSRTVIYLVCFLLILAASIYFTYVDMNSPNSWLLIYFFSIVISLYHIALYAADLFNRNSGIRIDNHGITLDFEHFKNLEIPWTAVSGFRTERSIISVFVHNPDLYLDKIFKVSALIIKGNLKRLGTFILIRSGQFHMDKADLKELLENTYNKYKETEQNKNSMETD